MIKKNCLQNIDKVDKPLTLKQAQECCFAMLEQKFLAQKVVIRSALNRVLAADVIAKINVPADANSAMDGFAFRSQDLKQNQQFLVIGIASAGKPFRKQILKNQCIKVMTGAVIPKNTDLVIPQEFVEINGDNIIVKDYFGGNNIRLSGEDIQKDSVIIEKGRVLNPSDLGLLASLGIAEINVVRKLRVVFFSTGDELCALTENLSSGKIYDSNRYSLYGLLKNLNVDALDMGIVKDDPQALNDALTKAAQTADVVITTGGVSVGELDFIKQVLTDIGEINFWKLAIKPGRPLTFGTINQAYFFGLPGNPVATMITFYQIVQPFLKKMMGQINNILPLMLEAISLSAIQKLPGRREFLRANLHSKNGKLTVEKLSKQGSGVLSSMSKANCLIVLSEQSSTIKAGDLVKVQLLS